MNTCFVFSFPKGTVAPVWVSKSDVVGSTIISRRPSVDHCVASSIYNLKKHKHGVSSAGNEQTYVTTCWEMRHKACRPLNSSVKGIGNFLRMPVKYWIPYRQHFKYGGHTLIKVGIR